MGKAKLALFKLCACVVLATEMADLIMEEIDVEIHAVQFYTDNKIYYWVTSTTRPGTSMSTWQTE